MAVERGEELGAGEREADEERDARLFSLREVTEQRLTIRPQQLFYKPQSRGNHAPIRTTCVIYIQHSGLVERSRYINNSQLRTGVGGIMSLDF